MVRAVLGAGAEARLRRVRAHIEELRDSGRNDDAEAVEYVRDLAEAALAARGSARPRELLTTGQAALALGLSDQTVRNWVTAGQLPAVRRGVRTMIPRKAVESEIERSRIRPSSTSIPQDDASRIASRQQLLAALPPDIASRLGALHDRLEDGEELSAEEQAEMVQLERRMANAAAHVIKGSLGLAT
jgi:excisionase family DNA binding protein